MAAESDLAVDFDDGNTLVEAFVKGGIGVDVDAFWSEAVRF